MNQNLKFLHSHLDGGICTTSFKGEKTLEAEWPTFLHAQANRTTSV